MFTSSSWNHLKFDFSRRLLFTWVIYFIIIYHRLVISWQRSQVKLTSISTADLVSRNTILIAWIIHDFRQTNHRFILNLSRELLRIVTAVIASIFRSAKFLFTRETISSTESIAYSSDWAINVDVFRRDAKQFYENTVEYRQSQIFLSFVNLRLSIDQSSFDSSVINSSFFTHVTSDRQLNLNSIVFRNNRFRDVNDSFVIRTSTIRLFIDFVFTFNVLSFIDFDEIINRSIKITTDISIEKIIYSQSIESNISIAEVSTIVDMFFSQNQLSEQMIDKALNSYVQRHFFQSKSTKSFDFSESSKQQNQNDENTVDNIKWNSVDLDFFDFFYDDKFLVNEASFIVNIDKNIYFRDVHLFIVRAKKMTLTRDEQLIRDNLWFSLRNTVLKWWTDELSDVERRLIRMIMIDQKKLSKWISLLHARFKQFTNVIMNSLMQQRYTLRDAVAQRESREYAQKIIRLTKDVDMINVLNQLNLIYNDIDVDVKTNTFRRFKNNIIINEMFNNMNKFKHDWWAKVVKLRSNINSQNNRQMSRQDARQQQFDQYDNKTLSSNFQRWFNFYFVNQFYKSNVYQNNQYIDYFRNYDSQSYDYQSQSYQEYQEYRSNQDQFSNVVLLTQSIRLQITVDSIIISTSNALNFDNQNQNQNQRRFFQFRFNQSYKSNENRHDKSQRMYQINVKNEMSDTLSEQTDERDDIDENENQNTYHDQHEKDNSWLNNDTQYESWYNDYDINFVICDFDIVKTHKCQLCNVNYFSKNKLFKHLRIDCWQQSINHIFVTNESIINQSTNKQLIEFSVQIIIDDEQKFRECHYAVIKIKSSINFEMLIWLTFV